MMGAWLLVYLVTSSYTKVAMTSGHVRGFESQKACYAAVELIKTKFHDQTDNRVMAACVSVSNGDMP